MSNVSRLDVQRKKRSRARTLCRNGFHKWEVVDKPFDVKRGGLVTAFRCRRCGAERNSAG